MAQAHDWWRWMHLTSLYWYHVWSVAVPFSGEHERGREQVRCGAQGLCAGGCAHRQELQEPQAGRPHDHRHA